MNVPLFSPYCVDNSYNNVNWNEYHLNLICFTDLIFQLMIYHGDKFLPIVSHITNRGFLIPGVLKVSLCPDCEIDSWFLQHDHGQKIRQLFNKPPHGNKKRCITNDKPLHTTDKLDEKKVNKNARGVILAFEQRPTPCIALYQSLRGPYTAPIYLSLSPKFPVSYHLFIQRCSYTVECWNGFLPWYMDIRNIFLFAIEMPIVLALWHCFNYINNTQKAV